MILNVCVKGIYLIERIADDQDENSPHYYVGKAVDLFKRWAQHCNENEQYIDKSIKKYGYTMFVFRILEKVSKESELNICETKWINHYKNKYGERQMYNLSQTQNENPHKLPKNIKSEIIQLFNEDIGRSIYAIAEKYEINWEDVMRIRKPLLKQKGLKYNTKIKNIVYVDSDETPKNWSGNKMTKSLSNKILLHNTKEVDNRDIAAKCNISITDLEYFYEEYNKNDKQYNFADEI